jgi:hypothetical protein
LRIISSGGSGIVYEARHAETGRTAAVKALRALQPEEQEGLRREVFVLSRLDHPGVVRVYESGIDQGEPWYAMELFRDASLAALWERPERPPLAESLRILRDLAGVLAFLHAEGVVHRDLKPANVMLREGRPVLVDFGFAARAPARDAREALERGGALVGTLAYIAPEQIRGAHVDARADLYSLGCMLHEAIAGEPPFGRSGGEVLARHLEQPPPPLPEDAGERTHALACLRDGLLAKDPHDRIGYADDAARELSRLLPDGLDAAPPTTPAYLYRPHFVGRRETLATLSAHLDRAGSGRGTLLLLTGESGAGKTRLAQEATALAATRGFEVVLGECVGRAGTGLGGAPLHPLASLLRAIADRCRHEGADATRALLGVGARVLAPYESSLAGIPGFAQLDEPTPLTGEAASARVVVHLAGALRAFAARAPILLILDDLQWADEMSLAALCALAREVADLPVVVLCTARSEETSVGIEELLTASTGNPIRLDRLSDDEISAMVSDMLAIRRPPEELVGMLVEESEGNPFFVAEYVRAAVAAGRLLRHAGRWQMADGDAGELEPGLRIAPPKTLQELVRQRLGRVPAEALPLLEAAAVLGREFDPALAGAVAGLSGDEADAAVAALVRPLILEESRGRLRFAHDKLREAAYAMAAADRRRALHARALDALEARRRVPGAEGASAAQLAHHADAGGEVAKAIGYYDLAGSQALEVGAYREAHTALQRARELDASAAGDALVRARRARLLGVAAFGIGDLSACIEHGRLALDLLEVPLPRSSAGLSGALLTELARRAAAPLFVPRPAPSSDPRAIRANEAALALAQLATSFFFAGASLATLVTILRCLRRGEEAGADRAVVEASMRLGFVAGTARVRPLSRHYFARAHRVADGTGDRRARAQALYFDAMHGIGLGLWEHTRSLGDRAASLLDEIGDRHEAEVALTIASHGFFYSGAVDEADERVAAVLATATKRSNRQHVGWGRFLRARTELLRGNPEDALAMARSAHLLIRDLPDTLSNVMLEGTLALAAAHAHAPDDVRAACDRLLGRLARRERPATGQCLDGLGAASDALLCLLEAGGGDADGTLEQDAARAFAALRRFARLFPIAVPAAQRSRARLLHLRGRHAAAQRAWRHSARAAQRLAMPLDEARVALDLARVAPDVGSRREHLDAATRLLAARGCERFAVRSLLASGAAP